MGRGALKEVFTGAHERSHAHLHGSVWTTSLQAMLAAGVILSAGTTQCRGLEFKSWLEQKEELTPRAPTVSTSAAPAPTLAPAPVTSDNNTDPFHPRTRVEPSPQPTIQSDSVSPPQTIPQEQIDYLRENAVGMKPIGGPSASPSPAQQTLPTTSPVFLRRNVTGFDAPQTNPIKTLPNSNAQPSQFRRVIEIGRAPARILLDSAKAAGSAAAPDIPAINMLKGAGMTSDILQAAQTGGSFAANEKIFEKSFVLGAKYTGTALFGTPGGVAAAGVAQGSYSTGKAIQPWLDSKLKLSNGIATLDRKLGISNDARALAKTNLETQQLQQRLDSVRQRPKYSSFGVTPQDVRRSKDAPNKTVAPPKQTAFANAPGKPKKAVDIERKPESARPPPRYRAAAPTYRAAPRVNCTQLQQQLYAYARSGSIGALCQIEDQLARYCGGPRGNFCGGGFGSFGGFVAPF